MPKKEEIPPLPEDALPKVLRVVPLANNDVYFEIKTDFQEISGTLSGEYALALLSKWAEDIHETALNGGDFKNTPFAGAGIKSLWGAGKYTPEESIEMLNRFAGRAATKALRMLLLRMVKLPTRAFIEGIIGIVLDMEESGMISIEGSRAQIWNQYAEEVSRTVKREQGASDAVRTRGWNEEMRRKALRLYEDTLALLKGLKKTYFSSQSKRISRQNPGLKSWNQVLEEFDHMKEKLLVLERSRPSELAVSYVGEVLGSVSDSYTWEQIKEARRKRRSREEKIAGYEASVADGSESSGEAGRGSRQKGSRASKNVV